MFSTGIVRKLDPLGRITIPKELRRMLEIDTSDSLEIFTDDDKIIFRKYSPVDIFTGEMQDDMIDYKGKKVSRDSVKELARIAGYHIEEK